MLLRCTKAPEVFRSAEISYLVSEYSLEFPITDKMFSNFKACLEFVQHLRDTGGAYSRHSRTSIIMTLRKIWGKSNFAQFGNECAYRQLYMHIQGITVHIQTPTHWNPFYRSMAGPPFRLSPSSILPSHSSHSIVTPARKNMGRV